MKKHDTEPKNTISVTVVNDVEEADIWILPQNERNLKTSLWGTATIRKLIVGGSSAVSVGVSEKYIVRIIDTDKAYYSASDITLDDGYTVRFQTDETKFEAVIEVLDQSSEVVSSGKAFRGVFGAN